MPAVFRFGGYELEPGTRELRYESGPVHVEQQVFDVLRYLAQHHDRVVSKTELLDEVWGDRFVSEAALTSRIKSARQAVGDNGDRQQVIRTIHGVGYRFVANLDVIFDEEGSALPGVEQPEVAGDAPNLDLRIRFVEVAGGVALAVAETGEGPYLVKTATWLTQVHMTTNSTNAPLLEAAFHDLDVSDLARQVVTPTLVLRAVGDRAVPFEEGRRLAGLIPGARFVILESRNHILLQRDAAFPQFLNEIERFTSS